MREPEGEGLAARAPDSPAAARPRPAAACPTAATAEREEAGCAAQPRAALAARATVALWTPEARRGQLGTGGAGRRDRAGRRSALPSSATRPLPPAFFARACALRTPRHLMSCEARGLAGLGGRAPTPPPQPPQPAWENHLALCLREAPPHPTPPPPRSGLLGPATSVSLTHLEKKDKMWSGGHLLLVFDTWMRVPSSVSGTDKQSSGRTGREGKGQCMV